MFSPSPEFLSDVLAFEAALIAIAIPLSFEIVTRISERYGSDVVSNRFYTRAHVGEMCLVLFSTTVYAMLLRFVYRAETSPVFWAPAAILALGLFFVSLIYAWRFFVELFGHATNSGRTVDMMLTEVEGEIFDD